MDAEGIYDALWHGLDPRVWTAAHEILWLRTEVLPYRYQWHLQQSYLRNWDQGFDTAKLRRWLEEQIEGGSK